MMTSNNESVIIEMASINDVIAISIVYEERK